MLREAGYEIAQTLAFPDHHRYTAADVVRIADAVRASRSQAVATTEKDAVRFEPHAPLPFEIVTMPMRLEIDGWELLTATIDAAIARAREAA
jgi:tetraacyldisaccharide 4'-kinase